MNRSRIPDVVINPGTYVAEIGSQEVCIVSDSVTTSVEEGCMYLTLTIPVRSVTWKPAEK